MSWLRSWFGRGHRAAGWAIVLTLLLTSILAGWGAWVLRARVRGQMLGRYGEVLHAMALGSQGKAEEEESALVGDPYAIWMDLARFNGILFSQLYDPAGSPMIWLPQQATPRTVEPEVLEALARLEPVTRFYPGSVEAEGVAKEKGLGPVVDVWVPFHGLEDRRMFGFAVFSLEGYSLSREFGELDRRLFVQGGGALGAVLVLTGWILSGAFRRLEAANRLLAARTADLQRANRELSQSARVSALGAVTAHLIHGLKNPISGLQSFIAAGPASAPEGRGAWDEALATTRRMQDLIQAVVRVVGEQQTDALYEMTLAEVAEMVVKRTAAKAGGRGVRCEIRGTKTAEARVDNRSAGLLMLSLSNLMENAIEASPAGGRVELAVQVNGGWAAFEVTDEGPGIPEGVRSRLFEPVKSTKEGGSGLGLAITRQLVLALSGKIELVAGAPGRCRFRVEIPLGEPGGGEGPDRRAALG